MEFPRGPIFNPLNAELNRICHLLALLGAHHILHVSRIRITFPRSLCKSSFPLTAFHRPPFVIFCRIPITQREKKIFYYIFFCNLARFYEIFTTVSTICGIQRRLQQYAIFISSLELAASTLNYPENYVSISSQTTLFTNR
jgi:hypothetical protein